MTILDKNNAENFEKNSSPSSKELRKKTLSKNTQCVFDSKGPFLFLASSKFEKRGQNQVKWEMQNPPLLFIPSTHHV